MLNATAKRLNRGGLGDHLNVTDDFFVYAVDLGLDDLDANLRAALDDARYRELGNSDSHRRRRHRPTNQVDDRGRLPAFARSGRAELRCSGRLNDASRQGQPRCGRVVAA